MTHWVALGIVVAYVGLLFLVTWWSRGLASAKGTLGYLLAGRQMPAWVGAAALAGLAVGGASTIGVAEHAYRFGISAGWYNAAWAAGAWVMGLVAAGTYRRQGVTSVPELFQRHYGPGARVLAVVGQLAIQVVITSLQYVAGGAILSSLLPGLFGFREGMLVTAVVFVGITLVGGFWAAGLTNVVNVLVIYIGVVAGAALTLERVGGLLELGARLPSGHPGFQLGAVGPGLILGWFLVMVTTAQSTQSVVQIALAARDEQAARRGFLLGGLLIFPVGFLCALLGMAAAALHPGIVPAEALPRTVLELPAAAAGLILAGLWAADVSTASALLVGSATLVLNDIVAPLRSSRLTEAGERRACRLAVLAISLVTFGLALTVQGILKMLLAGLTLNTAFTLLALMTMYWPAACRRGSAVWTMGATMVSLPVWLLLPARWRVLPHPIYLTWLASLVVFFAVGLVDRRPLPRPDQLRGHG